MSVEKEKTLIIISETVKLESVHLNREVVVDFYLPSNVAKPHEMSLLLINDGQDMEKMNFTSILEELYTSESISPLFCVGIHCGAERKREYGVAGFPDFKQRGDKADEYTLFIFDELLPYIRTTYHVHSFREKCFCGFSLGALSALDIVWQHPTEFTKVGVFSGSLWWRQKSYEDGYDEDVDRIMHACIRKGSYHPWLQFFFQCGAADESEDRNNNGIIDSIDDTLDLMKELKKLNYPDYAMRYVELADGKHDVPTWGRAMPIFLRWGWGIKNTEVDS
jgi:enterochelin esterase-like enzyme